MRLQRFLPVMFLAIAVSAPLSFAQISGDIEVKVADATGAIVPNATISIRSTETGTARSATADSAGTARFTQLTIGNYEVKVDAAGFSQFATRAVVNSGGVTTVPVTLEVRVTQQEVMVSETATP